MAEDEAKVSPLDSLDYIGEEDLPKEASIVKAVFEKPEDAEQAVTDFWSRFLTDKEKTSGGYESMMKPGIHLQGELTVHPLRTNLLANSEGLSDAYFYHNFGKLLSTAEYDWLKKQPGHVIEVDHSRKYYKVPKQEEV